MNNSFCRWEYPKVGNALTIPGSALRLAFPFISKNACTSRSPLLVQKLKGVLGNMFKINDQFHLRLLMGLKVTYYLPFNRKTTQDSNNRVKPQFLSSIVHPHFSNYSTSHKKKKKKKKNSHFNSKQLQLWEPTMGVVKKVLSGIINFPTLATKSKAVKPEKKNKTETSKDWFLNFIDKESFALEPLQDQVRPCLPTECLEKKKII